MTPQQEDKIDRCIAAVQGLSNHVLTAIQQQTQFNDRVSKLERLVAEERQEAKDHRERMRRKQHLITQWVRHLVTKDPHGPTPEEHAFRRELPSLSSVEDTGSIEIGALGGHAKFAGKAPVYFALAMLACAALILLGIIARGALPH